MSNSYKNEWARQKKLKDPTFRDRLAERMRKTRKGSPAKTIYVKIQQIAKAQGHAPLRMSLEEFGKWFERRANVCALCGEPTPKNRSLCTDHDHRTGEIRGVLCLSCNTHLGFVEKFLFNQPYRERIERYLLIGYQSMIAIRLEELMKDRALMLEYSGLRARKSDHHGTMDAAADIREIDAQIAILQELKVFK